MICKQLKKVHEDSLPISKISKMKPFEKKVQSIAEFLNDKPILRRIQFLDDLQFFSINESFDFLIQRIVSSITFRQFRGRMKRGLDYFKRGYNTFDFDSSYALEDFTWKLERLAKVMDRNDRHFGDKESAEKIREATKLFERVMKDQYFDEFEKEVEKKYGANIRYTARHDDFGNQGIGPFKNESVGSLVKYFREKWNPKNHSDIKKAERRKYKKAANKRTREWRKALNIIENHFFEWWD